METTNQEVVVESLKKQLKSTHVMYAQQQVKIFDALKQKFGQGIAEIIEKVSADDFCKMMLDKIPDPEKRTIDELINVLWEPLRKEGFVFTMEHTEDGVQMKCTVCPFARLYRAINAAGWGYTLYCAADEHLAKAYSDSIGFARTKTLMQGDDCCDHRYFVKR